MENNITGYCYSDGQLNHSHRYLPPSLLNILEGLRLLKEQRRVFEVGCGNGSVANHLSEKGWEVVGVDPSMEGIALANRNYPHLKLVHDSAYNDLSGSFGQFPVVLSAEVVEHVYTPREFAKTLFGLCAERAGYCFDTIPRVLENSCLGINRQNG
jgi:2-polyprenyl-3-methyl-5-hydroxy-6-metoxy-1,4-benzoquinol methylase